MEEPVIAFDLWRMAFGDQPPMFLLEIVVRTVIIYAYTLSLVRWIGGRSIGQLSMVEFLLVIALGSAVGDSMFYPDVPLLHGMLVITVVVLLDKGLSHLVARVPAVEDAVEGKSVRIVENGVIAHRRLLALNLGQDELFEQLRLKGIEHLGQVRGAYYETNGLISVFRTDHDEDRPGLSIVPPWDVAEPPAYRAGEPRPRPQRLACTRCATVVEPEAGTPLAPCPHCGGVTFHEAPVERSAGGWNQRVA